LKPVRSCSREGRTGGGSSRESFLFRDVLAERSKPIKVIKKVISNNYDKEDMKGGEKEREKTA
jgi:hypothetical protein